MFTVIFFGVNTAIFVPAIIEVGHCCLTLNPRP